MVAFGGMLGAATENYMVSVIDNDDDEQRWHNTDSRMATTFVECVAATHWQVIGACRLVAFIGSHHDRSNLVC